MFYSAGVYTFLFQCSLLFHVHNGIMALIFTYLTFNEIICLFMYLLATWNSSLWNIDLSLLHTFFCWMIWFFNWLIGVTYFLFMSLSFFMCLVNISHYASCLFTFLMVTLEEQNFLIWILSNFINLFLYIYCLLHLEKYFLTTKFRNNYHISIMQFDLISTFYF